MPQQDTTELKEKILRTMRIKGPSLPVHIAKETGLSILFASAFLSELVADKQIKISNMKVGSSPVYFIPTHSALLERFSQHLKSKEKDAFQILKEKKFLKDTEQEPAIRVALRSIRDFAIPFEKDSELYWRYFTTPESEFESKEKVAPPISKKEVISTSPKKISEQSEPISKQKPLNIFDKAKPKEKSKITKKKSSMKIQKKKSSNANEKFFNKIKEFLLKQSIEISSIEGFSKTDLTLKIKDARGEKLLVAYNKKRITESDILKAHKKANEVNLSYMILSLGEPTKKLLDFIKAIKSLSGLEKIK